MAVLHLNEDVVDIPDGEKIVDYIEFIQIINNENQIKKAFEQMILLIWNNMWILNFKFIEYKIKKFFIKYVGKFLLSEIYYLNTTNINSVLFTVGISYNNELNISGSSNNSSILLLCGVNLRPS